jgi:Protein of unknown function (DUF1236)
MTHVKTPGTFHSFALLCAAVLVLGCPWPGQFALAQVPAVDSGNAPALDLSPQQKQTIYQSISSTQKNSPAPTGFRAAVGVHVPDAIELKPMPQTLAMLIPAARDMEVAMVEKQVVLVDPKTKTVVAVVSQAQ